MILQNPIIHQIYQPYIRNLAYSSLDNFDIATITCSNQETKAQMEQGLSQSSAQQCFLSELINNQLEMPMMLSQQNKEDTRHQLEQKTPLSSSSGENQPGSCIPNLSPSMDTDSDNETFLKNLFS